jgi:hypothetical protein
MSTLQQRLSKIEKELDKVRGVEYSLPFGSMRRAKVSRKWDVLAQTKMKLLNELYSHPDYEDGMRLAEQETIIDP